MTEEGIALFVSTESLPLVVDFNHETAQKIFSGEVKSHFLLFSSAKADDYEAKVNININATTFIEKIIFYTSTLRRLYFPPLLVVCIAL